MWSEQNEWQLWAICCLGLTIDSGAPTHDSSAWNDNFTSVKVRVRFSDMEGDGSATWREVVDVSAGLDMARVVTRVVATFDDKDLQRGVGRSQSSCDNARSRSTWSWVSKCRPRKREYK